MNEKMRARAAALGISVQSITPELAEKWGTLMSPGQRRGQSKPVTPSRTALPNDDQPDEYELKASSQIEEGLEKYKDKYLSTRESTGPGSKEPG